jgi:hypothetical protein
MLKLKVELKDCYGIGELDHTFDFDIHPGNGHDRPEHSQTNLVYARNGLMKTSFAMTLIDYSENKIPVDGVHGRTPSIKIEADGVQFSSDNICVLRSGDEYFESDGMAALLSNKKDQKRYAEIMLDIDAATTELFDAVAKSMGIRGAAGGATELFDKNFQGNGYNRLIRIMSMDNEVKTARPELIAVSYKVIDNQKVATFLDKTQTQVMLKNYVDTFEAVLQQSKYFQDGIYDYNNAFKVQKSLEDNNFMKKGVGNKVIIVTKDQEEKTINSIAELKAEYEKDKNQIFDTLEKQIAYEKFDNEISANPDLRELQTWVRKHKELVPYLQNYKHTKTLTWQAHFAENMQSYDNLLEVYHGHNDELNELIERSRSYESEWKSIVESFKSSFRPKFDIKVRNQEDVVLKSVKPELVFVYIDDRGGSPKEVSVQMLNDHVFSTGERRALYILCMMFEIRIRMMSGHETLLVLDDIADSFDYKNKYAIIEYLYDLSVNPTNNVYMIILTHNYDFFRSLRMRCQMHFCTSPKVFIAKRNRGVITFEGGIQGNEFKNIKQCSVINVRAFLALIPLVRNLIEYRDGCQNIDYSTLTSVMHDKLDSPNITIDQVITIVQANIMGTNLAAHSSTDAIQKKIITEADAALLDGQDERLEDKLVLAMGIRLKAERYMRATYTQDGKVLGDEQGEQTGRWYEKFSADYTGSSSIKTLKQVNIVTPETLHINSFMFEPIVDMSIDELKVLYREASSL